MVRFISRVIHVCVVLVVVGASAYGQTSTPRRVDVLQRGGAGVSSGVQRRDPSAINFTPESIRQAINGNLVRLSWLSVNYEAGLEYKVYRHVVPIDGTTVNGAVLLGQQGAVRGENEYFDRIEDEGYYYYGVAPVAQGLGESRFFVVRVNATDQAIFLGADGTSGVVSGGIGGIAVGVRDDAVAIKYTHPGAGADEARRRRATRNATDIGFLHRDQYILRSTVQIIDDATARGAARVAKVPASESGYVDIPPRFNTDYFYAVVPAPAVESVDAVLEIVPGQNATVFPVQVTPSESSAEARARGTGEYQASARGDGSRLRLPLINSAYIGTGIYEEVEIVDPGRRVVSTSGGPGVGDGQYIRAGGLQATILPVDERLSPLGGGQTALQQILYSSFASGNWNDAIRQLRGYQQERQAASSGGSTTGELDARVYYYLGQSYFYAGRYQDAITNFARAQAVYDSESAPWVEASLQRLGSGAGSQSSSNDGGGAGNGAGSVISPAPADTIIAPPAAPANGTIF